MGATMTLNLIMKMGLRLCKAVTLPLFQVLRNVPAVAVGAASMLCRTTSSMTALPLI